MTSAKPWRPGRAVEHRERPVRAGKTLGQGLRRDLETAQMRGEKNHALTAGVGLHGSAVIGPLHRHGPAKPQAWQFGRHGPRMADGRRDLAAAETGLTGVVHETPAVNRRQQPGQPAGHMPDGVQGPQGPMAEKTKAGLHGA